MLPTATPGAPNVLPNLPRVLLVDDEESIRSSLRRYFARTGWEVAEAADGGDALIAIEAARTNPFDLILCDLRMPGMSGDALYARLERDMPEVLRQLVLVSGDVVAPEAASLLATARCRVLEKPFELKALAAVAQAVLAEGRGGGETGPAAGA